MGKLKKVGLIFLFIIALIGIFALRQLAFYPVENIDVSGKASSIQSDKLTRINVGNELAIFPETWLIDININVSNFNSEDIKLEKAEYVVYLENNKITEGVFYDISLESYTLTSLPVIQYSLDMKGIAMNNIQLLEAAIQNQNKLNLKVQVKVSIPALLLGFLRIGAAEMSENLKFYINPLDTFRVSNFDWKLDYKTVFGCNPGDELTGKFDLWQTGAVGKEIEAEIIEVVRDGSTKTLDTLTLEEELTSGYNSLAFNWSVPDSPPLDCAGYSVRILFEDVEIWCSSLDSPSIQLIRRYTLLEAFNEPSITITLRGRGYCSGDTIVLNVTAKFDVSVDLKVEPGVVLINSGAGQNMITAESNTVRLEPEVEVELKIEAYCLDLHKDNPSSSEGFTVAEGLGGYNAEVEDLMKSLEGISYEHKSVSGVQLALWVIIEDPLRSEVESVFHVGEDGTEDAKWLLQNIGIDPDQKNFFKTN